MKLRWLLGMAAVTSCATSGPVPFAVGTSTHALRCDAAGTTYQVLQDGTYVIHLDSKNMANKSGATLCIEPSPQGWRPPDPCHSDVRIDDWRMDRSADWIVELKAGSALAVWVPEGSFTTRAATGCPPGAQVDSAGFSGSGGFHVLFTVARL